MTNTIIIVEDEPKTLSHLCQVVSAHKDLELLGSCSTVADAKRLIDEKQPTVILTDMGLPDGEGTEVIAYAYEKYPKILTMVLSMFGDEKNVLNAILAGAKGYLLKNSENLEIGNSILQLINGASPISPSIARFLLANLQKDKQQKEVQKQSEIEKNRPSTDSTHHLLSKRESQVLELIAQGYRSKEIADQLCISYHTVVHHIRAVYEKLAVSSRGQAIHKASQIGLLRN